MWTLFFIIKVVALVQVILVVLLVGVAYVLKAWFARKTKRNERIAAAIDAYLDRCVNNGNEVDIKDKVFRYYDMQVLMNVIKKRDSTTSLAAWYAVRKQIIKGILLPKARVLAESRHWDQRYIACQALLLSLLSIPGSLEDEVLITRLIQDLIPLVSITAASLAIHYESEILINAVIDRFATGRRVQQSLYAVMLTGANRTIITALNHRLSIETDPYIKAFCYRVLTELSIDAPWNELALSDLDSENMDLKLAALAYIHSQDPKDSRGLLLPLLHHEHWELRAKSAKFLGMIGRDVFAEPLEQCLRDPVWWVRINAAEALAALGKVGLAVLKRQSITSDRFAYDVATQMLMIKEASYDEQ